MVEQWIMDFDPVMHDPMIITDDVARCCCCHCPFVCRSSSNDGRWRTEDDDIHTYIVTKRFACPNYERVPREAVTMLL